MKSIKRSAFRALFNEYNQAFIVEIEDLVKSKMLKPKAAEDIKAGHIDGMRNMARALQAVGVFTIEEDETK